MVHGVEPLLEIDPDALQQNATQNEAFEDDQYVWVDSSDVLSTVVEDELRDLPYADCAAFNSSRQEHQRICLPKTRASILSTIYEWSVDPHGKHIFWLNGIAGTGKSTIARTVSRHFSQTRQLAGSYFFSRGGGDLGTASKFVFTILRQLLDSGLVAETNIRDVFSKNPKILGLSKADQWRLLIVEPLTLLEGTSTSSNLVIVIDALDECDDPDDVRLLIQLFASSEHARCVRFFVTSRPEQPLNLNFGMLNESLHQDVKLHEAFPEETRQDIITFYRHEFEEISKERDLPADWATEQDIEKLEGLMNRLFIFAATTCRFIRQNDVHPKQRLEMVLRGQSVSSQNEQLNNIYLQVLQDAILRDSEEENLKLFREAIGPLVVTFDNLGIASLAALLGIAPTKIRALVESLGSVLNVPTTPDDPITLLHPSFREFLLDAERCTDSRFLIDKTMTHKSMAQTCMNALFTGLKKDMCNLKHPGILISEIDPNTIHKNIPPYLQYACNYWARHVDGCVTDQTADEVQLLFDQVYVLLRRHFLHWCEALSLLGKMHEAILQLSTLRTLCKVSTSVGIHHQILSEFVQDAYRFSMSHRPAMEQAPLQAYCSAFIFSPSESQIREHFKHECPPWVSIMPEFPQYWDSLEHTLEGHPTGVHSVAFSPDGTQIISGSESVIRVWNTATGVMLRTLDTNSIPITKVLGSPDGSKLFVVHEDDKLRLWDISSGKLMRESDMFVDRGAPLALSPDGRNIATPMNYEVNFFDVESGILFRTFCGHDDYVVDLAISIRGHIASAALDGTVRIWSQDEERALCILKPLSGNPLSITFSPDGSKLLIGTSANVTEIFDIQSAKYELNLGEQWSGRNITSIAISSDGSKAVTGSSKRVVHVFDLKLGTNWTLKGHLDSISAVAISSDGSKVVSGSKDGTVRVWDTSSEATLELGTAPHGVDCIRFSVDGVYVVSGSHDGTIRRWSLNSALQNVMWGYQGAVQALAFHPTDGRIAFGSFDGSVTIRHHGNEVEERLFTNKEFGDCVLSLAFSKSMFAVQYPTHIVLRYLFRSRNIEVEGQIIEHNCGRRISTVDENGHVYFLDHDGREKLLHGHLDPSSAMVLTETQLACTTNGVIHTWELSPPLSKWQSSDLSNQELRKLISKHQVDSQGENLHPAYHKVRVQSLDSTVISKEDLASMQGRRVEKLEVKDNWIMMSRKRIVWLPSHRRGDIVDIRDNKLAIGSLSGIVTILGFAEDKRYEV